MYKNKIHNIIIDYFEIQFRYEDDEYLVISVDLIIDTEPKRSLVNLNDKWEIIGFAKKLLTKNHDLIQGYMGSNLPNENFYTQ